VNNEQEEMKMKKVETWKG